jgi:hypothetical protein
MLNFDAISPDEMEGLLGEICDAINALEERGIPVVVSLLHRELGRRFSLDETRHLARLIEPEMPEELLTCSGCREGWCSTREFLCVPDSGLWGGYDA